MCPALTGEPSPHPFFFLIKKKKAEASFIYLF